MQTFRKIAHTFSLVLLVILAFCLLGAALLGTTLGMIYINGFASILFLLAWFIAAYRWRLTWEKPELTTAILTLLAGLAMLMDLRGNHFYNLPMAWLYGGWEAKIMVQNVLHATSSGVAGDYVFHYMGPNGQGTISAWWMALFRFIQYCFIFTMISSIIGIYQNHRKTQ